MASVYRCTTYRWHWVPVDCSNGQRHYYQFRDSRLNLDEQLYPSPDDRVKLVTALKAAFPLIWEDDGSVECPICRAELASDRSLRRHLMTAHNFGADVLKQQQAALPKPTVPEVIGEAEEDEELAEPEIVRPPAVNPKPRVVAGARTTSNTQEG
jgi:hypothetical protein